MNSYYNLVIFYFEFMLFISTQVPTVLVVDVTLITYDILVLPRPNYVTIITITYLY